MPAEQVYVKGPRLVAFCQAVFESLGLSEEDAFAAADVLVAANVRGIPSHGVARLQRYVNGLKSGDMVPDAPVETLMDTPTSLVLDANGAMGAPVSVRAMRAAIEKAQSTLNSTPSPSSTSTIPQQWHPLRSFGPSRTSLMSMKSMLTIQTPTMTTVSASRWIARPRA